MEQGGCTALKLGVQGRVFGAGRMYCFKVRGSGARCLEQGGCTVLKLGVQGRVFGAGRMYCFKVRGSGAGVRSREDVLL